MQIFHIDGLVIATHDDGVPVPAGAYPGARCLIAGPEAIVADSAGIRHLASTAPTDADVRAEYERRLLGLLEARDLAHAAFVRADDQAELRDLQALAEPDAAATARIAELIARSVAIGVLIERYNAVPSPPPADYADPARWV